MKLNRQFFYFSEKYEGTDVEIKMAAFLTRFGFWSVRTKEGLVIRDVGSPGRFLDDIAVAGMISNFALDKKGEKELHKFFTLAQKHMLRPTGSFWEEMRKSKPS